MSFDWATWKTGDLDSMQFLPGYEVANLKAETLVDANKGQSLLTIHGERANVVRERADGMTDRVRRRVRYCQER